jgi:hypothetical protein
MTFDPFKQAKLMKGLHDLKSFRPSEPDTSIDELKALAGVREDTESYGEKITQSAQDKAEFQRKHNIRPGDAEWFKLWFAEPKLTGEDPFGKKR